MNTVHFEDYRFEVRPLSADEGGGYLVSFPDLPGCMSDGETYEEAIANARDAFASWVAAYQEEGRGIPAPNSEGKPAKFVLRVPRHLHERVTSAAAADGVSVNTTVVLLIAEGLARREGKSQAGYSWLESAMGVIGTSGKNSDLQTALRSFLSFSTDDLEDRRLLPVLEGVKKWTPSDVRQLQDLTLAAENNYTSAADVPLRASMKRVKYGRA